MDNIIEIVIALLGILGIGSGLVAFLKDKLSRKLIKEISDVVKTIQKVRDEKSDKGKQVSSEEAQEVIKEVFEVVNPLKETLLKYAPKVAKKLNLDK